MSISELTTGVNIALSSRSVADCPEFDIDASQSVAVAELVTAVRSALAPTELNAEDALVYTGFDYADPFRKTYDPPLILGGAGSSKADRTLKHCGLYDNGFTDPDQVVRNSKRPTNALECTPTHCAEGRVGEPCSNGNHSECDTSPGDGDGMCDACSAGWGLTTDDEMFILAGSYVVPPETGVTGK